MIKKLSDALYSQEIERMSQLAGFPLVPAAQLEYRRVLRRITETDKAFLHNLISDVIDSVTICPTPAELMQRAGVIRQHTRTDAGGASGCAICGGSGYVTTMRQVSVSGLGSYETGFAARCQCRGGSSNRDTQHT